MGGVVQNEWALPHPLLQVRSGSLGLDEGFGDVDDSPDSI